MTLYKKYSSLAFFVPFVFLIFVEGSFSQSINLEQLGNLSKVIGGEMSSDISDVEKTDQNQGTRQVEESTNEPEELEYGYRGKKDSFIVEPRPKLRMKVSPFGYDFFQEAPSTFSSAKSFLFTGSGNNPFSLRSYQPISSYLPPSALSISSCSHSDLIGSKTSFIFLSFLVLLESDTD